MRTLVCAVLSVLAPIFVSPSMAQNPGVNGGRVQISEIMYHPPHPASEAEDTRLEWVELFNGTAEPVNVGGWKLADAVDYVLPVVVLEAGGRLVVAADVNAFSARYPGVTNVVGGWTGWLSNSGERLALLDNLGVEIDAVTYADEGDWAVRELGPVDSGHRGWEWSDEADGGGKSLEVVAAAVPNEFGQNWAASLVDGGTPGSTNSVAIEDIAPMILEVRHRPLLPGPSDPVLVTARIIDEPGGSATVRLRYRVDRSAYTGMNDYPQANAGAFTVVAMSDEGRYGDGAAGDGVYGAQIPPHADGAIVEFSVEAVDVGGRVRTWPAPSLVDGEWQQVTNALYRVDAKLDPEAYWQVGGQPLYYIIMTEAERGRLAYIGTHSGQDGPDTQMNGTFISLDGTGTELRYRAGVRNRGHGTRNGPPNNYHVNFPHDQTWKGIGAINFNCRYTHAQILGSAVFSMAGIAAAHTAAAQVRINGADLASAGSPMYGSYVRLEAFDDDFAKRHFPDDPDGDLYTCFRTNGGTEAELRYEGTDPDAYRNRYFKANHATRDDWSDLIHLVDVLDNAPDETYLQEVGKVINLSQWLRYLALDALLLNYETGLRMGIGDDYFLYRGVTDPRFVLIPHDLDTILDQGNTHGSVDESVFTVVTGVPGRNGVEGLKRLFNHPDIAPLYFQQLLDLIDTVLSPGQFDPLVDQVLGGWAPPQVLNAMKQFVVRRNAAVLAQIPRELTINSVLAVVDGYPYTTAPTYALFGTADAVETRSVLVNGVPAVWSPREGTWQSGEAFGRADSLVDAGSEWKYLDDGSDQGTAWHSPAFDDSTWRRGRAELGYGDGGEATVVNGGPSGNRFITTYFRKAFTVSAVSKYLLLRVRLLADDGAVVYLNGAEAWRNGMPDGPISYTTRASASLSGQAESTFVEHELPLSLLREGVNVLAVEVHQNSPSSSDISFDLALEAVRQGEGTGELLPGINRIIVQSFDSRDGAGNLLEEGYFDIWYDNGGGSEISGTLASDKVLAAASGPWYVTSTLTVPAGRTLTIEPGATLFFQPGMGITVNGLLVAEGTPYQRITFTKVPGSGSWAGLQFLDTPQESRLAYVNMEYCDSGSCAVRADHAAVYMDHVVWANHAKQYLTFDDSSVVLKNSVLPSLQGAELVHFWDLPSDGWAVFEGNWFGSTTGYNDIIDFTGGQRPGPIAQFRHNVFTGATDDGIDLDAADAHVEGNIFMHVRADAVRDSQSHAISTGTEYNRYSEVTAVRNLFYDVDHAFLSKDGGFITAVNNTVVHATHAAVNMYEVRSGQWQGKGFYGDGNIFYDVAHVFENPDWVGHPTAITMNNSIFPVIEGDPVVWAGVGNLEDVDPQLYRTFGITDPQRDMRLLPTSPALGAGPNGRDMGGLVPPGASIAGEPLPVTWRTDATLTVGGPDIDAYKYRINDGPWSAEVLRPDADLAGDPKPLPPIRLVNLQNGQSYTVYVVAKDSAGVWQDQNQPTAARTWTVDTSHRRLVINEVLAANQSVLEHQGSFPDLVELFYDGPAALSLAGMSLSDHPDRPDRFVFPAGATIHPGEYLILYADSDMTGPGHHLGFAFKTEGDSLYLYDATGVLIDAVEFGAQLSDLSVGRIGGGDRWGLTIPTFGQANIAYPLGDPRTIRINEWLAGEDVLFASDFVELYNPHRLPVDLGGFYLTDTPETEPDQHRLRPLSFIAGGGYAVFRADGQVGPGHLGFKLSSGGDMVALFDAAFGRIDEVIFGPQTRDVSQGRSPDGAGRFAYFPTPTPGAPNPGEKETPVATAAITLIEEDADKRVLVPTGPVTDDWQGGQPFDDSAWLLCSGAPGGVGYEHGQGYESLITLDTLSLMYGTGKNSSCYVRIPFAVDAAARPGITSLTLKVRYDDGFVAYLNGAEIARREFTGTPAWNSEADSAGEANGEDWDEWIDVSQAIGQLQTGANLLAIHAMNSGSTSSDFLISVALDAVVTKAENELP
jgi:hypothetical protein